MSRFFRQADDSDSDTEESEEELMTSDDEATGKATDKPSGAAKFLKGADSGDSDESSEGKAESEEEDSDEEKGGAGRFLVGGDDEEESEEDVKRIVKSASEKRIDEMEAVGKTIDNAKKINDWVTISNGAVAVIENPWRLLTHGYFRIRQAYQNG